jgi:outer membrane protein assembly factor BamB
VVKLSLDGDVLWTKCLATSEYDGIRDPVASGGALFAAGTTNGTLPGQSSQYGSYISKLDVSNGNEVWTHQFDVFLTTVTSLAADATGVYLGGWTGQPLPGQTQGESFDLFARKYDLSGVELWTRQIASPAYEGPAYITIASDRVYLTGRILGAVVYPKNHKSADSPMNFDTGKLGE